MAGDTLFGSGKVKPHLLGANLGQILGAGAARRLLVRLSTRMRSMRDRTETAFTWSGCRIARSSARRLAKPAACHIICIGGEPAAAQHTEVPLSQLTGPTKSNPNVFGRVLVD